MCIAHTRLYEALHHKKISFFTGAKTFNFKIECNDGLGVSGAVINDSLNFNDSTVNIKSTLYYKIFEAMDTLFSYITKL